MSNEELVDQIQKGINESSNIELLYNQNIGFICKVVKKYRYAYMSDYNSISIIEMDNLIHEAYFGLIEATKRYTSNHGTLFLTYATHWISQAVRRFLENSGQVIRVPVHRQQEIYKYNQATSYYLRHYNRMPSIHEYTICVGLPVHGIEQLEKYMFRGTIQSIDENISESYNSALCNTLSCEINIEDDIVERVVQEQIKEELWDIVAQVLKDEKKLQIIKWRFIDEITIREIGTRVNLSTSAIERHIIHSLRKIRCNSKTKRFGAVFELWKVDKPANVERVRELVVNNHLDLLTKPEIDYAIYVGWLKDETLAL